MFIYHIVAQHASQWGFQCVQNLAHCNRLKSDEIRQCERRTSARMVHAPIYKHPLALHISAKHVYKQHAHTHPEEDVMTAHHRPKLNCVYKATRIIRGLAGGFCAAPENLYLSAVVRLVCFLRWGVHEFWAKSVATVRCHTITNSGFNNRGS